MQLEQGARFRIRGLSLAGLRVSPGVASWAAAAAIFVTTFGVYLTTLAPSVMWYDMGEFAVTAETLGIAHNTGYPLLILTGKAVTFLPYGDTAWRVNLVSAVFTSLAVTMTFAVIRDLTRDTVAAAIGAMVLAFAATVWANATWATSYGMNLFFVAGVTREMLAWHRDRSPRALALAALFFGLGLCNHRLIVLVAPPSAIVLAAGWRSLSVRSVAMALVAFLAGLSFYLYLPIRGEMEPAISWANPPEWRTYWSMFLNGQTPGDYWSIDIADRIDVLWAYPSYDLTWAGLAIAAAGAVVCASRDRVAAAYLGTLVVLTAIMVETYAIHNVYNYLTPGYFALCVFIGVTAAWMNETVRRAAERRGDPRLHARLAAVAAVLALLPAYLFFRNYERVDRSEDFTAIDFARTTLDRMPPDAVILTDTWTASPLWYAQLVEGRRRDVLVSPVFSVPSEDLVAFARHHSDHGDPVYVAEGLRVRPGAFEDDYTVQPVLLESIERMVVDSLPKPEYRDDLVMTGSLYKLLPEPPETMVESVPAPASLDVAFDAGVTLSGFEVNTPTVQRGEVAQLTYYWRADRALDVDLSATALFFDAGGHVAERVGIPVWSQPHDIGQGVVETSAFEPGAFYKESYFSLVPRTLAPGTYDIRVAVFDAAAPGAFEASRKLVSAGTITVR